LYTIYRDVTSTFTPAPGNQIGTSATNSFTDANAVSLPATKYFYVVTSSAGSVPAAIHMPSNGSITAKPAKNRSQRTTSEIIHR
jgi:hypothetical protein